MAAGASGNVIATAFVRIQPETTGFGQALRQTLATNLLQLEKQSDGFLNKIEGSLKTTAKLFATTGVTSLSLFGAASISSAKDLEKTSNAFKGLFGGVDAGRKEFDKVFALAEKTPFEGSGLAKDFQKFTAAFASAGVPVKQASDKTLGILQTLADGGSALGASSDNISGFALALTQTIGKGKLTGEEVRQMTNNLAGFNVVGAVAAKTGKTNAEVYEDMRAGAISADLAIDAITEGLNKIPGAAGASQRQLRTLSGSLSTLKDVFQRSTFDGLEKPLKVVSNAIVDNAEIFRSTFKNMAEELGGIIVTSTGIFSEVIADFDQTFGKLAIGGIQSASAVLYGFKDGLNESFKQLGRLGQLLQDNQGYFVLLGKSFGNLSEGFSIFFTDIVVGFEPIFKVGTQLFELFSVGVKNTLEIFGGELGTGFSNVGLSLLGTFNKLRDSFSRIFDNELATEFIKSLASVGRSVVELVIDPLDALGEKSDQLAVGLNNIFKEVTPAIKDVGAAFDGLGGSFGNLVASISAGTVTDLIGSIGRNLAESIQAITTFGAIGIDILSGLLSVVQPLVSMFGDLSGQVGAAFLLFKITGSPLLTLISLFKDVDTGLVVFLFSLSKAIPIIRQFQASLMAFKATDIASNLSGISLGMRSLVGSVNGLGAAAPQSAAQFIKSMVGVEGFSKTAANNIIKNMGPLAKLPAMSYEAQRGILDFAGTAPAATRNVAVLGKGIDNLNKSGRQVGIDFTSARTVIKGVGSSVLGVADNVAVGTQAWKAHGKEAKAAATASAGVGAAAATGLKSAAINTELATSKASGLSSTLGGIKGIVGTLGLAVGVSLLTSKLASSAEAANKAKQQIKELAEANFNYLTAKTGTEKQSAVDEGVKGLQERFGDDTKLLEEFNKLLKGRGLDQAAFFRLTNKSEKERVKILGELTSDYLKGRADGKDLFESSIIGKRNISDKANEQAMKLVSELAASGGTTGRGLDLSDKGVKELIAKKAGVDLQDVKDAMDNGTNKDLDKILKDAGFDKVFQGKTALQFTGAAKDIPKILEQIGKAGGDAAAKQKAFNAELKTADERAKDASASFKAYGEAQKTALSSTSAFFDKVFELNNEENLANNRKLVETLRPAGFKSDTLLQSKEGRDFLTPFLGLVEAETAIKTNVNAPVAQTINLLRQSNEEVVKFGENIHLLPEELARVQVATGDLTFAEDLGEFVGQLSDNLKLTGPNLKAVIAEAVKLSEPDQKAFLASIPTDEARKLVEDGMKDIQGNVILSIKPEVFTNLSDAVDRAFGGAKKLTLEFALGSGVKNFAVLDAIKALTDEIVPIVTKVNDQFKAGSIDAVKYGTSIAQSRQSIVDVLFQETGSLQEAKKIYAELGLVNEIATVKTLIDGYPLDSPERNKILKGYLANFSNEEYPLKLKAQFTLDPEQAVKDFTAKAEGANKKNDKFAFKGVDNETLLNLTAEMDSTFLKVNVLPEIDPAGRASFLAAMAAIDPKVTSEILPYIDAGDLKATLDLIPDDKELPLFAAMDQVTLANALSQVPPEKILPLLTQMDKTQLASALGIIPPDKLLTILADLPEVERDKVLAQIKLIDPTLYAKLLLEEEEQNKFKGILRALTVDIPVYLKTYSVGSSNNGRRLLQANGGLFSRETDVTVGEAGFEAIIPVTRPKRALSLMKQSGLYDLVLENAGKGGSTVSAQNKTFNNNTQNINIDARNNNSVDPDAMAMFLASRLSEGIRR